MPTRACQMRFLGATEMAGVVCSLVHTDAQESKSATHETASPGRGGCVYPAHPCSRSSSAADATRG